jgi:SepF-like predicted cell division protein (DUF552 family)
MAFKIFEKRASGEERESYVEVDSMGLESRTGATVTIRVEKLNSFDDTERVLRSVRNGDIVLLKIKGLKDKDIGELKRCVERLKKSVVANNGDIVGVEQDWLVLAPENIGIDRGTAALQ